jgi:hypothetical protein
MTKDESRKEVERLERLLETEKYIREQERKGAEYEKEIVKDNNSKTIGYLAGLLLITVMIIWGLMGGK